MVLAARPDRAPGPGPNRVAFVEALRRVPAEQRRALVLYHLADLTVAQIAAETGVRPGTVKAHEHGPATDQDRPPPAGHRHHPRRENRLRGQQHRGYGDPDPDRHEHGPATDQDRRKPI
jgi:hypothetical protein